MIYDCPKGCVWTLDGSYRNKYGEPYDGVACPTHQLYCGRRGRRQLWPFWKLQPQPS